jgi:hypothetical protein
MMIIGEVDPDAGINQQFQQRSASRINMHVPRVP